MNNGTNSLYSGKNVKKVFNLQFMLRCLLVFIIAVACFVNFNYSVSKVVKKDPVVVPVQVFRLESKNYFLPPRIRSFYPQSSILSPPVASSDVIIMVITVPSKIVGLMDRYEQVFPTSLEVTPTESLSIQTILVICKNESVTLLDHQKSYHVKLWQINCEESYFRLNRKIGKILTTARDYFDFSLLIKVDDDTYPCFGNFLSRILSNKNVAEFPSYIGKWATQTIVATEPGLWFDPTFLNSYPGQKTYPVFMKGAGYALSSHLIYLLSETANDLSYVQNEDVMVGLWVLPFRKNVVSLNLRPVCYCSPYNKNSMWFRELDVNETNPVTKLTLDKYLKIMPLPDMYHHCYEDDWAVCRSYNLTCDALDVAPDHLKNSSLLDIARARPKMLN